MITESLIVLIVALTTRILIVYKSGIDFDTYGHLYLAKEVKNQHAGPFGYIIPNIVAAKTYRHPYLWHWIIGLISFDFISKKKKWINAILDTLFVVVIYYLVYLFYRSDIAFIVAMLYIFTPILFSGISTGPRIHSLTPRITSEIAVNLFFFFTVLPLTLPDYIELTIAIVLGIYVLLSSKFGVQAIVFLSVLISLFLLSIKPILVLLASLVVSIIISRGMLFKTIKHQAIHLTWYFKKNLKGEMHISNRNSLSLFREILKEKNIIDKSQKLILSLLRNNSLSVVLFKMPILPISLYIIIYTFINHIPLESLTPDIFIPVQAAVAIYTLVNIPVLLFIGEAERYLNHIVVFILLLSTTVAIELNITWVLWLFVGYGILYWLVETFFYNSIIQKKLDRETKENEENVIINFLQSTIEVKTVLSFPYHAVGVWRIMLETIHKTVYPIMVTKEFAKKFELEYDDGYPYVNLNRLNEMDSDFGLDILIINNKKFRNKYNMWVPPINWIKVNIAGDHFTIYRNNKTVI